VALHRPTTSHKWWLITKTDAEGGVQRFYESAFETTDALQPPTDVQTIWSTLHSGVTLKLAVYSQPCHEFYVCGAGVEKVNGKYTTVGTYNDALDLQNSEGVTLWRYNDVTGQSRWIISEQAAHKTSVRYYVSDFVSSESHHPPAGSEIEWLMLSSGEASTPLVSTVTCDTLQTVGTEMQAALRGATFKRKATLQLEKASEIEEGLYQREEGARAAVARAGYGDDAPNKVADAVPLQQV